MYMNLPQSVYGHTIASRTIPDDISPIAIPDLSQHVQAGSILLPSLSVVRRASPPILV